MFPQYSTSTGITQGCQSDKELKACSHQLPGNSFEQKEQQYFIFLQINISQKFEWECVCTFKRKERKLRSKFQDCTEYPMDPILHI